MTEPDLTDEVELVAVRKFRKRPATAQEVKTTLPFFSNGSKDRELGRTGVLLIHGFTATPATFRDYAISLASDGYTVSVPLLPGHGIKPSGLLHVTKDDWLESVLEAYDEIDAACDRVFVVGISLGSALSLQLATRRDGISKLLLLSPAVYPTRILQLSCVALLPLMKMLGMPYWFHVAGDIKQKEGFELAFGKTAINGLYQLLACMRVTQKILSEVKTDVIIFQGRTDHEIPADRAEEILQQVKSSEKEMVWLEDSYHEIPRDNDAESVLQRIRQEIMQVLNKR